MLDNNNIEYTDEMVFFHEQTGKAMCQDSDLKTRDKKNPYKTKNTSKQLSLIKKIFSVKD